jgi:hypothetical protein
MIESESESQRSLKHRFMQILKPNLMDFLRTPSNNKDDDDDDDDNDDDEKENEKENDQGKRDKFQLPSNFQPNPNTIYVIMHAVGFGFEF